MLLVIVYSPPLLIITSNLRIVRMDMKKIEYITEIAISSQKDAEIYDIINRLKGEEKNRQKNI